MKLTFCGAAREVTGSCILVETENLKVLVDCGMFQGASIAAEKNREDFPFKPSELDAVIITHAHMDHIGRYPLLVKRGFKGRAFCTHPTRQFAKLMWIDAAKVMKEDAKKDKLEPIYRNEDVFPAHETLHGVEYGTRVHVKGDSYFTLREAGHIFGSAFIEFEADGKKVVFSGDLGNDYVPILRDTADITIDADAVVMESTYGDRVHEDIQGRRKHLQAAIRETVKRNGTLMIPAFSLERTQEILYELNEMVEGRRLPRVSMYLDSPLAIKVLPIYHRFPEYYDTEAAALAKQDDFFQFPGLKITRKSEESKLIVSAPTPKVIIAGSGMMHGGRIMRHLVDYLADKRNTVLIVGFQAPGTLGRQILEGANRVHIDRKEIVVNAKVTSISGYSAHADQLKLLRWCVSGPKRPRKIILDHGEISAMEVLANHIRLGKKIDTVIPEQGVPVEI